MNKLVNGVVVSLAQDEIDEANNRALEWEKNKELRVINKLTEGVQNFIDSKAKEKQYRDGYACASYASSTIHSWSAEANAFIAWRDNVWSYSYTELTKFENGERQAVTIEEFLSELPVLIWPN